MRRSDQIRNKTFTCVRPASANFGKSPPVPGGDWPFPSDPPQSLIANAPAPFVATESDFDATTGDFTPPATWKITLLCNEDFSVTSNVRGFGRAIRVSDTTVDSKALEKATGGTKVIHEATYTMKPGSSLEHEAYPGMIYEYRYSARYHIPGFRCHYTYLHTATIRLDTGNAVLEGASLRADLSVTSPGMSLPEGQTPSTYVFGWPWQYYLLEAKVARPHDAAGLPAWERERPWELGALYHPSLTAEPLIGRPEWGEPESVDQGHVTQPRFTSWLLETEDMQTIGYISARGRALITHGVYTFEMICGSSADQISVYRASRSQDTLLVPRTLDKDEVAAGTVSTSAGLVHAGYKKRQDVTLSEGLVVTGPSQPVQAGDTINYMFSLPKSQHRYTWQINGKIKLNTGDAGVSAFLKRISNVHSRYWNELPEIVQGWETLNFVGKPQVIIVQPIADAAFGWLKGKISKTSPTAGFAATLEVATFITGKTLISKTEGVVGYNSGGQLRLFSFVETSESIWVPVIEQDNRVQMTGTYVFWREEVDGPTIIRTGPFPTSIEHIVAAPVDVTETTDSAFSIRVSTVRAQESEMFVTKGFPHTVSVAYLEGEQPLPSISSAREFVENDIVLGVTAESASENVARVIRLGGGAQTLTPGSSGTVSYGQSASQAASWVTVDPVKGGPHVSWLSSNEASRIHDALSSQTQWGLSPITSAWYWTGKFSQVDVELTPAWPELDGRKWGSGSASSLQKRWQGDQVWGWQPPRCKTKTAAVQPRCAVLAQGSERAWSAVFSNNSDTGVAFGDQRGAESAAHLFAYHVTSFIESGAFQALKVRGGITLLQSSHDNGHCIQFGALRAGRSLGAQTALPPRGVSIIPGTGKNEIITLFDSGTATKITGYRPCPSRLTSVSWTVAVSAVNDVGHPYRTSPFTSSMQTISGVYDDTGQPVSRRYGWDWTGMWPVRSPAVFQGFPIKQAPNVYQSDLWSDRGAIENHPVPRDANLASSFVTSADNIPEYEWFNKTLYLPPTAPGTTGNVPSSMRGPLSDIANTYVPETSSTIECVAYFQNGDAPPPASIGGRLLIALRSVLPSALGNKVLSATAEGRTQNSVSVVFQLGGGVGRNDTARIRGVLVGPFAAAFNGQQPPLPDVWISLGDTGFFDGIVVDDTPLYNVVSGLVMNQFPGDTAIFPPFGAKTRYTRQPTGVGNFLTNDSAGQSMFVPCGCVVLISESKGPQQPGVDVGKAIYGPYYGPLIATPTESVDGEASHYGSNCVTLQKNVGVSGNDDWVQVFNTLSTRRTPPVELTFRDLKRALSDIWNRPATQNLARAAIIKINRALRTTTLGLNLPQIWNGYAPYNSSKTGMPSGWEGQLYYQQTGDPNIMVDPDCHPIGNTGTSVDAGEVPGTTYQALCDGQSAPVAGEPKVVTYELNGERFVPVSGLGGTGQKVSAKWSNCVQLLETQTSGSAQKRSDGMKRGPSIALVVGSVFYESNGTYNVVWNHAASGALLEMLNNAYGMDSFFGKGIAIRLREETAAWTLATT